MIRVLLLLGLSFWMGPKTAFACKTVPLECPHFQGRYTCVPAPEDPNHRFWETQEVKPGNRDTSQVQPGPQADSWKPPQSFQIETHRNRDRWKYEVFDFPDFGLGSGPDLGAVIKPNLKTYRVSETREVFASCSEFRLKFSILEAGQPKTLSFELSQDGDKLVLVRFWETYMGPQLPYLSRHECRAY